MAGRSNKSATRTDKLVGQMIRTQRLLKGLTQTELGTKLGVTFQQIQKYEYGTSRVSSGRLFEIAGIFEVPVKVFFESQKLSRVGHASPFDLLDDPMSLQMLREFSGIRDKDTRRSVLALVEQMAAGKTR
jgi:transcriptional regulator with XRE-family HTH domain